MMRRTYARVVATIATLLTEELSCPSLRRESGQTLTEYALILSLIAVVVIAAVATLGGKIKGIFNSATSAL